MANRSRGAYDIVIDSGDLLLGFNLAHEMASNGRSAQPAVVSSELSPARLDEVARNADVPRVIDNLDAGMGYSRRLATAPNGYAYCLPGYTRAPGGIFSPAGKVTEITLPPTWNQGIIVGSERFQTPAGTFVYLFTQGRDVLVLSADGTTATVAHTFPAGFAPTTGCTAIFNNRLYVSGGSGVAYLDGATGAWSAVFPVQRAQIAPVAWRPLGVPTEVLVGISHDFGPSSALRWCPITADPTVDANWSAPVRIGAAGSSDVRYQAKLLVTAPRHVYTFRPDGVWDIDELGARSFNIAPWIAEGIDQFNGGWGLHIGDGLYYAHAQGLAFVPTQGESQYRPEWCHPGWGLPYEGPIRGLVGAGTLHGGWGLVGIIAPGEQTPPGGKPQSYICAAHRDASSATGASHVWHGAEAVVVGIVQHMRVWTLGLASGAPKLLITTHEGDAVPTVHAYWQSLSRAGTPIQELLWGGGFEPADAASLFLPADAYDRPSAVKSLLQFEMVTERLEPSSDVLKLYAAADGGAYTEQGTADQGTYTSFAPLELTEGRYINARVDAIGSPILRSLELRAAVGVELREARVYRVILGYDNALKTARGREHRDPMARMLDLQTMLGRVVVLEDEVPMRVRVLQVMAPERRQLAAANRAGAWALVVPILVSILDHPFRWDGADRFDVDRTWG